jgi:hypothetical protein
MGIHVNAGKGILKVAQPQGEEIAEVEGLRLF